MQRAELLMRNGQTCVCSYSPRAVQSWAVNECEMILVDRSYWALSSVILCALSADWSGYVFSNAAECFVM